MKRIIFSLPEELFVALHQVAEAENRSVAAILREAAELSLAERRTRPRSRIFGLGASAEGDIGRRIGEEEFVPEPFR